MANLRKLLDKCLKNITEGLGNLRILRFKMSHSMLLELSLLSLIILIAVVIRLLPMRWGFYLSEFDPYFQYRIADHMVNNGFLSYNSWIDNMGWYPYGRDVAHTSYPGLGATAGFFYLVTSALGIPISLFQLCVLFPVIVGGAMTCLAIYFLGKDVGGKEVGLLSAFFLALNSSHISRTSLGFFDDETVGILGILLFTLFFLRSIESERSARANLSYAIGAGLSLGYIFASWGASRYAAGIAVALIFILILLKRYSSRLLLSYSTTFGIALFTAVNIPYLGFAFLTDLAIIPIFGVFLLLCACEVAQNINSSKMKALFILGFVACVVAFYFVFSLYGFVRPLEAKYLSAIDPFARLSRPIFESVAEHKPAAWGSFYYDLGIGAFFVPIGLFFVMQNPSNRNIFLAIFGLTSLYFASTLVRMFLILAPAVSILWAVAFIGLMRPFITIMKEPKVISRRKVHLTHVGREFSGAFIIFMFLLLTFNFVLPTTVTPYPRILNNAYSPTTIASAGIPLKPDTTVTDWVETLSWINKNLPQNAVVVAWWDYGYWITVLGNRTSLSDNATFNSTQIQLIAKAFMSNETEAVEIYQNFNKDAESLGIGNNITHVLVFTNFDTNGNDIGYGDEGKARWMADISEPLTGLNYSQYRNYQTIEETGAVQDVGWNEKGGNSTIVKLMTYGKQTKLGQTPSVTLEHFKLAYYSKGDAFGGVYALVCVYEVAYNAIPKKALVRGTITDDLDYPLAEVTMTLDGYSTITDSNGQYSFVDIPADAYTMTASATGYQTKSVAVDASSGGTIQVDVSLTIAS